MRIGIDIDDTITNSWDYLMPTFSKHFNISIDENTLPYYGAVRDIVPFEEFSKFMNENEQELSKIPLKENVVEVLNKLKQEGHQIIFITARGKTYNNPYQFTKDYLDKYNIPYDKIVIDSWDKSIACKEEKIDLFIDDSPKHCKEVVDIGIDVLMMETKYNQEYNEFTHVKNWNEVYKYIQQNR